MQMFKSLRVIMKMSGCGGKRRWEGAVGRWWDEREEDGGGVRVRVRMSEGGVRIGRRWG